MFFECSFFSFFVILGALRLHFCSHFDSLLGALGLWKNIWKCVTVVNFRDLAPSRQSLFAGLDCGCVLMVSFCRFLWFWVVLGLPFWDLLVPIVVKKGVRKKGTKSVAKRECRETGLWGCGPLKHINIQICYNLTGGPNTPWRAYGTVADIYIHIYIYVTHIS